MKKKNLTSLSQFIDKEVGLKGTKKRDRFDTGYEAFKLGALIQQARQEKGLTQEQVAELSGTNKSYISKLEKDLKDVRFWLMCWKKFGADATQEKFLIQFPEKKGFLRYGGTTPQFYNYLNGKILFLGMVRGTKDEMFLKQKMSLSNRGAESLC